MEEAQIAIIEYQEKRKDKLIAYLLLLFLGGIGVHKFYMGNVGLGITYILLSAFFWLIFPLIFLALFLIGDLFFLWKDVDRHNAELKEKYLK